MPKRTYVPLTDVAKDSHRVTLGIHLAAGDRAFDDGNWSGAATAYQLALSHANAIHDGAAKREVFASLNRARSRARLEAKNAETEKENWAA